jgi:hypothetical protein
MAPRSNRTMNNNTRAALLALAEALAADPAGCRELNVYGHLPDHLADAVGDLEMEQDGAAG